MIVKDRNQTLVKCRIILIVYKDMLLGATGCGFAKTGILPTMKIVLMRFLM